MSRGTNQELGGISDSVVAYEGGWWPPGDGEPGKEWEYEPADLSLRWDGGYTIDVLMPTPDGERALVSVPLAGIVQVLARGPQ